MDLNGQKKYKPIHIVEDIKTYDNMDEDKITKQYMCKYGIDNVRGGTYTQVTLPEYQYRTLLDEICTSSNLCFKCKKTGHFAKDCDYEYIYECEYCNKEFNSEKDAIKHEKFCMKNVCYRCGRYGHLVDECYAKTHLNGKWLNYT